jgi:aspartate racemase
MDLAAARPVLGVVGGLGPLASAEFLRTLYRLNLHGPEQSAPRCLLFSDPTFPDRTEALLAGREETLVPPLNRALENLFQLGASRAVIACMTIHAVLPRIPATLRRRVVSLVDLAYGEIAASAGPCLLLATTGTRTARIFERHERWPELAEALVTPDLADQEELHARIYRLKRCAPPEEFLGWIAALVRKYRVETVVFGCTELHLLQGISAADERLGCKVIDPLWTVARDLWRLLSVEGSGPARGSTGARQNNLRRSTYADRDLRTGPVGPRRSLTACFGVDPLHRG